MYAFQILNFPAYITYEDIFDARPMGQLNPHLLAWLFNFTYFDAANIYNSSYIIANDSLVSTKVPTNISPSTISSIEVVIRPPP